MTPMTADGHGPLVVACLKITDLRTEVDPLDGSVRRSRWGIGLSAADGSALEHALRICEAWSGRLLAIAVGPASVEPVLRQVAALGASVMRVPVAEPGADGGSHELAGDQHALARRVVEAVGPGSHPSLVVCGDRSVDRGTGSFPAFVAHELGAAQALGLVSLETEAGGGALVAERRLDGGWRERLRVPLPAVCSVEGSGVRLRRASLDGLLAAGTAVVPGPPASTQHPVGTGGERARIRIGPTRAFIPRPRVLPPPRDDDPRLRLLALTGTLEAPDPPTLIGPVGSDEAADALIAFLVHHGYLDHSPEGEGSGPPAGRTADEAPDEAAGRTVDEAADEAAER
jgi:electron transfer flavoprotein beta subunit